MKILWLLLCLFFSFQCAAEKSHSRIELYDGSTLYGKIKTQDHGHETYTVELLSGPTLELDKAKIKRIKKIKAKKHKPYKLNISKSIKSLFTSNKITNTIFINRLDRTFERSMRADHNYLEEYIYKGMGLGWRHYLNSFLATQLSVEHGQLEKIRINSQRANFSQTKTGEATANKTLTSISATGLIGLSFYSSIQLFGGVGIAHDRFDSDTKTNSRTTVPLQLGIGVTWRSLQINARSLIALPLFNDYSYDMQTDRIKIDLGWHF